MVESNIKAWKYRDIYFFLENWVAFLYFHCSGDWITWQELLRRTRGGRFLQLHLSHLSGWHNKRCKKLTDWYLPEIITLRLLLSWTPLQQRSSRPEITQTSTNPVLRRQSFFPEGRIYSYQQLTKKNIQIWCKEFFYLAVLR